MALKIARILGKLGLVPSISPTVERFTRVEAIGLAVLQALAGVQFGRLARIGFGCKFKVETFIIEDETQIRRFNPFVGPVPALTRELTEIGARNTFWCSDWVDARRYASGGYALKPKRVDKYAAYIGPTQRKGQFGEQRSIIAGARAGCKRYTRG